MSTRKKTTKVEQFTATQNEQTRSAVAAMTVDTALSSISAAQAQIGKTLASVGEQVQSQLQSLDEVKHAVTLEKIELESLHGKDALLSSIEELQEAFETKKKQLEAEHKENLRVMLYAQEEETRRIANDQAKQGLEFTKRRLAAEAELEVEMHNARVAERNRKEALEKDWALREESLKKRESVLSELQAKVDGFPALMKSEVDKQVAIATNSLKRDYTHQMEMLQKDAAAAKQVSEISISTLKGQYDIAQDTIIALNARLAESDKKVESIANKALEAASARQALTEVQSFVQNRDNGASPSRKS